MKVLIFGTARRFIVIIVITSPGLVLTPMVNIISLLYRVCVCVISILVQSNDRIIIETF